MELALSITPLTFGERITDAELKDCFAAAAAIPVAARILFTLLAAERVRFDDPRLEQGVDGLIALGIIAPGRRSALLSTASAS
jgi:hypothetical protein